MGEISPLWQSGLGFVADLCALVGSLIIALEVIFKESRHNSIENLRHGIRLLLTTKPTKIEGEDVLSADHADTIERRVSEKTARIGACILVLGFFLQVVNRGIDIARELKGHVGAPVASGK